MRLIYSVGHPDGRTAGSWSATSITSALWFVFPGGRAWHAALTGRGMGIKESIRAPAPFSPPYISPPLMSVFWFSFQLRPSDLFCKQRGGSSVMWVHSMWVNSLQDKRCGGVCPVHIYTFLCPRSGSRRDRLCKHKYGYLFVPHLPKRD